MVNEIIKSIAVAHCVDKQQPVKPLLLVNVN